MALKYVGVNLSGLELGTGIGGTEGTNYVLPSEDNYAAWAQDAGSNIIRLPFSWERLQPTADGPLDQTYLSYLQSSVAYAEANGETIILDMHNYGLYNGQPATAAELSNVWTQLGQVFSGNSSVWFDLMNEPNNVSATQWESVEQQTVNAMRADGINNKLLLEGTAWSGADTWITSGNAAAFANFKDPDNNYAYDVHQYLDSDGSGTSATAVTGSGSTRLVAITQWAESTGQQLFLGETGLANNAGSETEMKAMITYMNAHTDAWLGMTLWGAGPWWPQNYIYNVNPTGLGTGNVANASDITDLLSYLTPSSSQTTNSPPVAQPDNFTGQENAVVSGNVLANNGHGADTDPNGLALSVAAANLTSAHGGTVVLNADGSFTYHPASNFTGTDSFTYTLNDAAGLSTTGTVTLAVNASSSQSPPVAQADNITGQQYHTVTGNVLANNGNGSDTDPNGLALSVTAANLTTAHGGTVVLNADGTFTYNAASGFYGADSFTYTLKDSAGLSTTGTVNINVNAAPVSHPDDISVQENTAISGNVLANNGHGADSDPVAATLSVTAETLTTAHGGHVSLLADGSFTYTPASGFAGTDSFNYTLLDGRGGQADGTVTLAVSPSATPPPVNQPPVAQPDNFTGQENAVVSGNVLANNGHGADTDPNGLALSVAAANLTSAHGGTVVLNADGSFTYHPASNFTGADSFTYTLKDSAGLSSTGTVTLAVNAPANQPPVAQPDNFTGQENAAVSGNVLANNGHGADTDPNGLALSVAAANLTSAHGGTVVLNADGSFTYHPASNFTGTDSFTYTLNDAAGLSTTGTVTLAVNAAASQPPPVAQTGSFTDQQYHSVTGNVLSNNGNGADTDPNGLALSVAAANLTTAQGGTVVLNANGTFTYNAASGFYGADSFTYTLKDSAGLSTTGTVNINVNAAPVSHPDDISVQENTAISGNVLANNGHGADSDPVAATLSVTAETLTTAHGGHVSLLADGSFTYTPASGFAGTDSFNYTLLDGRGGQADGTVTLAVSPSATPPPVNQPPVAQPDNFTGQENAVVSGNVLANNGHGADTDPNGLALGVTAASLTTAHGGTAVLNADGSFTYHPAANFYGADSFTYALHDTSGLSATGTVSIAVSETPPSVPVINGTSGNDTLTATNTGTILYGLGGNDKLYGGTGNDTLVGGTGADTMTGGKGNDVFKYSNVNEGGDIITDFHHLTGDTDTLDLTALFAANGLGSISTATAIQRGFLVLSQHIDGLHVDFDRNGPGGAAAVHLVTLTGENQQHLDVLHQILTASS